MSPEVRAFVDDYARKPKKNSITIQQLIKSHNHEIWKTCFTCGHHFDIRKETTHDRCPICKSFNIK